MPRSTTRALPGGPTCTAWASLTLPVALALPLALPLPLPLPLTLTLTLTPTLPLTLPLTPSRYGLGCYNSKPLASLYWGSHQRFFKELCMSFKVRVRLNPTLTLALNPEPNLTL